MLQTLGPTTSFKHSKTKSLCCNITLLFAIHPHPFCQRPLVLQHYTTRTEPNRTAMSHEPNRTEPPCHANRNEPACWWTEPPLFEVSTNRNEPKRTEAFLVLNIYKPTILGVTRQLPMTIWKPPFRACFDPPAPRWPPGHDVGVAANGLLTLPHLRPAGPVLASIGAHLLGASTDLWRMPRVRSSGVVAPVAIKGHGHGWSSSVDMGKINRIHVTNYGI